jgi:hypothetical protein
MQAVKIDADKVFECVKNSWVSANHNLDDNYLLAKEWKALDTNKIPTVPAVELDQKL